MPGSLLRGVVSCRCQRWSASCKALATQEDLLCDLCRIPGCSLISFGPPGQAEPLSWERAVHVQLGEMDFTFTGLAL
jgi:hypothetical protein